MWEMFSTQTCAGSHDWHPNNDAENSKFDQLLSLQSVSKYEVYLEAVT